jgi:hypothetical protein
MMSLIERLKTLNPDAVIFDDMDAALIGFGDVGPCGPVAVYSKKKIYAMLADLGLSPDETDEYYAGRFIAVWGGEHTPLVLNDLEQ